jgi:hypothetical protein
MTKMYGATFWAIFAQTHLVTLFICSHQPGVYLTDKATAGDLAEKNLIERKKILLAR